MKMKQKFKKYFKKKGLTQKEVAELINYRADMVGRYMEKPNYDFIISILKLCPDIDLNYLFKEFNDEKNNVVSEPNGEYGDKNNEELLKIIEEATSQLRANLTQN